MATAPPVWTASDDAHMARAIELAAGVRTSTPPNPWVGALIVAGDGTVHEGATAPPGGPHAEVAALDAARAAGADVSGATAYVTLEPCSHVGRTGPCADTLLQAGVGRVVVGVEDPDPQVAGQGIERLRAGGVQVDAGCRAADVDEQLAAYLHHRRTGRPYVVLKLAATLDGRTAAPDGTSQWITGADARTDAHRLRAESQAIIVGAGTVATDDPSLTTRHVDGPDPSRIVLGHAPDGAKVHPCLEWTRDRGSLDDLLDRLGGAGMIQVLVEGGATVAAEFHARGLVDRYVVYLAPVLSGGDDAPGLFAGPGAATIDDFWRGELIDVSRVGADVRIDMRASR